MLLTCGSGHNREDTCRGDRFGSTGHLGYVFGGTTSFHRSTSTFNSLLMARFPSPTTNHLRRNRLRSEGPSSGARQGMPYYKGGWAFSSPILGVTLKKKKPGISVIELGVGGPAFPFLLTHPAQAAIMAIGYPCYHTMALGARLIVLTIVIRFDSGMLRSLMSGGFFVG